MIKSITYLLPLLLLMAFAHKEGNMHLQHKQLNMSFYLPDGYNTIADTSGDGYGYIPNKAQFKFSHLRDSLKELCISYHSPRNPNASFDINEYGTLEARYQAAREELAMFPSIVDYKHYFCWVDNIQYLVITHVTDLRPQYDMILREDEACAIVDGIGAISLRHSDRNYNPTIDSARTNRMIDSLVSSIRIKR